jgi:hypothetical protein
MRLQDFLTIAKTHPEWIAYALADGVPLKIVQGTSGDLEARAPKKIQGRVQLELCLVPNEEWSQDFPQGAAILQAEAKAKIRNKSSWHCVFEILDADDVLERRRAPRMRVHRMKLIGRFPGESTWIFPIAIRDVGPEGLGIETHESLDKGNELLLAGFQEFFPQCQEDWRFEVRSTFGKTCAGLQLLPGQDAEAQMLRDLHADLGVVSRFWRSLVGHARHQKGLEPGGEMRVSIEFSIKQLKQRRAAQLALISDPDLEALGKTLKDEGELTRIKQEIANLQATKKALTGARNERMRGLDRFLNQIQPVVPQPKPVYGKK